MAKPFLLAWFEQYGMRKPHVGETLSKAKSHLLTLLPVPGASFPKGSKSVSLPDEMPETNDPN